jgi:hypothetical protein
VIDLHLHTTASDGTETPAELVSTCRAAGLTTIGVADHDTVAGVAEADAAARAAGLGFVAGIEISSAWRERDIHILGYFIDEQSVELSAFLEAQREDRVRRARVVAALLRDLGAPIDMEALIARAKNRPVTRPAIAAALVEAGHASTEQDAFDRFVGEGRPAYAARAGATPAAVVRAIRIAGGMSSMAHPGITKEDGLIPELVAAGLDALEVYHPDHEEADVARYRALALACGLALTGGSDYHGTRSHHDYGLGRVTLPADEFAELCRRAGR